MPIDAVTYSSQSPTGSQRQAPNGAASSSAIITLGKVALGFY